MQTFLPYPNIEQSLKSLEFKRLGKQRVEAFQILNIILKRTNSDAWKNHPVIKMWKKHPNALKLYYNQSIKEWISRGYKNNMKFEKIRGKTIFPDWWGNKKFHDSHKSNLLRKNSEYYSQFNWDISSEIPYFWPIK
jgi:hypothetical protein